MNEEIIQDVQEQLAGPWTMKTNAVRHALERQDTPKIKGAQNEDNSITEGSIVFDILFRAKAPEPNSAIATTIKSRRSIPFGFVWKLHREKTLSNAIS